MTKKHSDFQPLLDYFRMLRRYEQKGYIEAKPQEHEAYITAAALLTLVPTEVAQHPDQHMPAIVKRLRAWCAFRLLEGEGYLQQPFAVHVVGDEHPHDLLSTILVRPSRHWHNFWRRADDFSVINYQEKEETKQ